MQALEPKRINLVSTNIAGPLEDLYDPEHTYSAGELAVVAFEEDGDTPRTPHVEYRSLRANNTGRYPPEHLTPVPETTTSSTSVAVENGSKTFTVDTGKTFVPGMALDIKKTTTPRAVNMRGDVTAYNADTGQLTVQIFQATGEGTHGGWTIELADEIGFWQRVGATNQWAMFDEYVETQTESAPGEPIDVVIDASRCDTMALFGLSGERLEAELADQNTGETVETWDVSLRLDSVTSIWEYFFLPYEWRNDLMLTFPVYYNATLRLTIYPAEGGTAKCGHCIPGMSRHIGMTQFGASVGIQDYSRKETDEDGRTELIPGAWAKRMSIDVEVENANVDKLQRIFASLRGRPTVWQGNNRDEGFESLLVFGFYHDFEVVVPGPVLSRCALEIHGLI